MGKKEDKSLSSSKGEVKKSTLTNGGGKDEVTDKFEATIFFLRTQEKMLKSHVGILNTIFVQRLDDKCKGKYIPAPIPTSIEFHSESESEEEYSDRATAGGGADECSASDSKKKSRENSSTQRQPSELLKMMMQREEAERSDLFEYPAMNYGCLSELSSCYRMDTLLTMCTDLAEIANSLHRSLLSIEEKAKANKAKLNQMLDEAIKIFEVTNAIAEVFSITPLPKSKLPEEGAKFAHLLGPQDEMDFFTPTNEGLQIVADPEQYILKFEGQIDHMRTAVNEIGKCLITITRVLKSIVPGTELIDEVSEHKIDALIGKMPPSCGEAKRITLSSFSSKLLSNAPRDKPCMQHFDVDDDPCLLAEELYEKLRAGEKVWDFEKGPFISDSEEEYEVRPADSGSTRSGKAEEITQPSSSHTGRRHMKAGNTSSR